MKSWIPLILAFVSLLKVAPPSAWGRDPAEVQIPEASERDLKLGKKFYEKYCVACHAPDNIMVPSPKFGDLKEWSLRLKAAGSLELLARSAMNGKSAMPKKGNCEECQLRDLRATIQFMIKGEKLEK